MSPSQAAVIVGCSVSTIREAIKRGSLYALQKPTTSNRWGIEYNIPERSLKAWQKKPKTERRGWVRGRKRN